MLSTFSTFDSDKSTEISRLCAPSEGSDHHGYPLNLIKDVTLLSILSKSAHSRHLSDFKLADTQTVLIFCLAYSLFNGFVTQ